MPPKSKLGAAFWGQFFRIDNDSEKYTEDKFREAVGRGGEREREHVTDVTDVTDVTAVWKNVNLHLQYSPAFHMKSPDAPTAHGLAARRPGRFCSRCSEAARPCSAVY